MTVKFSKEKFAKLFQYEDGTEILALRQTSDDDMDEEEIRFFFIPDGLGLCSMALKFTKEKRFEVADKLFAELDNERVMDAVQKAAGAILDEVQG